MVGDVAGHGVSSALLMSGVRAGFRQRHSLSGSIEEVVADLNRQVALDVGGSGRFMTLFCLEIDVECRCASWVRAGHEPGFLYRVKDDRFEPLMGKGIPLGIEKETTYSARFIDRLEPGDMLYVPRGLAHDAIATDKTSLHITTGLMLRSWADVVAEAVNALAHADVDFRRALPPGYANPGADMAAHKPVFDALVAKFAQNAPFEKLMDGFKQEFLTGRVPRVEGQMAEMAKLPSLTENSVVGARPDLIYDLAHLPEDEKIRLACYGAEIIMPDFVEPALRYAVSTARFKIADLPGDLDEAGQLVLIRRLIREGLVVVHQA